MVYRRCCWCACCALSVCQLCHILLGHEQQLGHLLQLEQELLLGRLVCHSPVPCGLRPRSVLKVHCP